MVCTNEVATRFSFHPVGPRAGPAAGFPLRRTGFLMPRPRMRYKAGMQDPEVTKKNIVARARAEGFDVVRFTDARAEALHASRLHAFLHARQHGTMNWMEKRADWRANPQAMWPDARSVIV